MMSFKMFGTSKIICYGKKLRLLITFCSCTGFLLLGYDQGLMGTIIGADNRFGRDFNHPDSTVQGLLTSVYDLGCVGGSIICFFIGEKYGRRSMMFCGGFIMIIGTIILAASQSRGQFYAGRIITGIGNGFNSSTIPVYQSECALASNRGSMLTWQAVVTIFGVVIAYWVGYGTSYTESPFQWRFPVAFQGIFAISLTLETFWLPETPRWLVTKNRKAEATQVLAAILDKDVNDRIVIYEKDEIEKAVELEGAGGPFQFKELFGGGDIQNFRRLLLTIGIMIMQQFTGSNMINYYAPVVYQSTMKLSRNTSLILAGCTEIVYLAASFFPLWAVERFGRRPLLLYSSAGLSFCFIAVSILLSIGTYGCGVGAACFIFIYQIFMGVGWLPVPWFYPSEINVTRLRSRNQAIGSAFNWLSVFAVVQITPISINNIGWKTFIIFAILNAVWIPIIYCFYPETKGLELEDIDHIFEKPGITRGVFSSRGKPIDPNEKHSYEDIVIEKESIMHIEKV